MVAGDFNEPMPHCEDGFLTTFVGDQFAGFHLRHQGRVIWVNAELPLSAGQAHGVHVLGVHFRLRGHDLKLEGAGHNRRNSA